MALRLGHLCHRYHLHFVGDLFHCLSFRRFQYHFADEIVQTHHYLSLGQNSQIEAMMSLMALDQINNHLTALVFPPVH